MNGIIPFFKPKIRRFGIDIGYRSIKALEVIREGDITKIRGIAHQPIENPDSEQSRIEALKETAGNIGAQGKAVNIAVAGSSVICRFLELPKMKPEELHDAVSFEVEKYIPYGRDEVMLDHHVLIPQIGESNKMLVLLAASRKEVVTSLLNMIEKSGLSVRVLDVTPVAIVNAFLENEESAKKGVAALIDIGAKTTNISVLDGGILHFMRTVQLGGDSLTNAIAESLSIDAARAEEIKRNKTGKGLTETVRDKIASSLQDIANEVRLSFSYFENQSGKSIERLFLSGGGARVKDCDHLLGEKLGIEAAIWDPVRALEIASTADEQLVASLKEQMATAVGLALRE